MEKLSPISMRSSLTKSGKFKNKQNPESQEEKVFI